MRTACPWPWKLHNSRLAQGGAVFGGGKGGSGGTTYQTQATTIPPEVRARYDAVNARAEQVAQQPFQPYTGQFVAPMTSTQQAGIQQIAQAGQGYQPYQQAATTALTGAAEAALPYYGQAGQNISAAQAAGAPYTGLATMAGLAGTQAVNAQPLQIGQYMDPYIQSVVTPTMQGLYQQQQQQQSQLMGSQAMRGAFGGDRGAIAAANLARQQGLAAQQAQAGLLSGAYGQALTAAQQQQGVGLQAAQANRAALQQFSPQALQIGQQAFQQPMATAQAQQGLGQGLLGYGQGVAGSLAGLGQQGTQTGLASGQALLGAGTLQQQTQQQLNAALYNQYLQQQGYPFQVAQFLANIALGTGPLYGSTTTGVTGQPTPFFSDERVKEDIVEIGRTHDGQRIIKFRYKGEPEGTSHIGLSAQDVEKHHPEAVSETPEGIKAVDYDAATKHAERAYGGGLLPSSEGGAVHPSMAGLGFAAGGVPVPGRSPEGDKAIQDLMPRPAGLAPRAGFADGGDAEMLRKMYPWGAAGSPGKSAGWTPGLSVKPQAPLGSNVQFQRPAQQQTGLSQAIGAVKGGLGAIEDAEKIGKAAKGAYDWVREQTKPYSNVGELLEKSPDVTRESRGGLVGYAEGGDVDESPAIPYGGDETPLGKLASHQVTPAKLDTPKLDMSGGAGGGGQKDRTASTAMKLAGLGASFIPGVGPALGAGLNIASGLFARGGEVDPAMMADAKRRIAGIESGGRYDALGPMVGGDRAHGKYQVMGRNIGPWTEEALGRRMTPEEFLKNPEAQERVFEHHFGKSLKQHGNLADAASIWHSGVPLDEARRQGRRDVNMSTEDYVRKIMGGVPMAEHIMARKGLGAAEPSPAAGGLAPAAEFEDMPEVDTAEFRALDMPKKFATGGLAGRHGYQTAGAVQSIDPDQVDPNNLDQTAILTAQQQRGTGLAPAPVQSRPPQETVVRPPATPPGPDDEARRAAQAGQGLGAGQKVPGVADDRDLFNRMGDWYERNQNWLLPAVSGIGKMLASPSPYLGVAIGQGLAEAAPTALAANFKQQGLDINMMDRLGKQIGVLASDIALRGGPGMDPTLDKAQQAAMARYYRLSGVNYTPALMDPAKVREQLASSPFAKLRFADNPDLLYRAAQTPGLAPEQKQQFLKQASEAATRLADQGYGLDENGAPVQFPNIQELLRNSLYGKAVASTAGSTAGSGVPGGSQYLINLRANVEQAQQDYERTMARNNNNAQHPDVLAAERKVQELRREYARALSPTVGRASGGRTGYATDGAVDDMTDVRPMEDNVQLAQATPAPTVPTMPNLPKPPSQAPAARPPQPVPTPSPEGMPSGAPQTAADYRKLYQSTLGLVPQGTSDMYLRRADELEREAVGMGKQSTGTGVTIAPGAIDTQAKQNNAAYNTKWLQEESNRQQDRGETQTALDVLTEALTHVNTNPLAPFSAKVTEYARGFGFNVGTAAERAAAVQEIAKQVARQSQMAGTDLARNMSQEGSVEAIKNPMANRAIMAQAYAKLDYDRAKYDYFLKELNRDRSLDPAVLQRQFEETYPREDFYKRRYNELALPGSTPFTESGKPDWGSLKVGARYYLSPDEVWKITGNRSDRPRYVRVVVEDGKKHLREE